MADVRSPSNSPSGQRVAALAAEKKREAVAAKAAAALAVATAALNAAAQATAATATTTAIHAVTGATEAQSQQAIQQQLSGQAGTFSTAAGRAAGLTATAGTIGSALIPALNGQLAAQRNQLAVDEKTGATLATLQSDQEAIGATQTSILQASLDIQTDIKQAAETTAQAAVDAASQAVTHIQAGQTNLGIAQQLAGQSGTYATAASTAASTAAIGGYIAANVLPALQTQLAAQQSQLGTANSVGDETLAQQIAASIDQTQGSILQAQLDAMVAVKQATEQTAQANVDAATHAETMASTGQTTLSLQQQLAGTASSPGAGVQMSSYILTSIVPALQAELGTLNQQLVAERSVGNATLATQIAEAIASKQNDILQAQLDAANAIEANTQPLTQLAGQLGVSFEGQYSTPELLIGKCGHSRLLTVVLAGDI